MIEEKILSEELRLETIEEKDGKFYFIAKALNKDFECEDGRRALAKDSINKHLIWRHQHPIEEGNKETHIYGRVLDAWLDDESKEIYAKYEVYGHTPDHVALREAIKERHEIRDPLGISMRYRKYYAGGKAIHYDVLEHSATPFPACKDCKTINFEVKTMENEEIKKENEEELDEEDELLSKTLKKIEELEKQLDSKTKILEEYKAEVVTLEKELKKKEKALEEKEVEEKSLEETIEDLRLEVERLKKKPIIDKILEIKPKIEKDEKYLEWLRDQDEDYLKEKLEEFTKEAESKPIVKSLEESAKEAREKSDEELEKKEPSMEHFTKHLHRYQAKLKQKNNSEKA